MSLFEEIIYCKCSQLQIIALNNILCAAKFTEDPSNISFNNVGSPIMVRF